MGQLVVMHYPTVIAGGAADHTYVMCGTGGKAWSCWGGKTGGSPLRSGSGSTRQANAIAGPQERAGITCYLINGVCHQAANRILVTAGIFASGARGYGLSVAIYGPYGRPTGPLGTCRAPFNRHANVSGDLPECLGALPQVVGPMVVETAQTPEQEAREGRYLRDVLALYAEPQHWLTSEKDAVGTGPEELMLALFGRKVEYDLGPSMPPPMLGRLMEARRSAERARVEIEAVYAHDKITPAEFVETSDAQAMWFQKATAEILKPDQYRALFDLEYGEVVRLADPDIVKNVYSGA